MSSFIKAEKVSATALGLLRREITLPQLVWSSGADEFTGAKNDTISLRVPAYAPARKRSTLRSGARQKDNIHERKVDVSLNTDVYKDVGITDAELSLDIANFGEQVLNPVLIGIAEALEQEVADQFENATYAHALAHTLVSDDPYETLLKARARLNSSNVPFAGRAVICGTQFERALLKKLAPVDTSGSSESLREARIGRVAGMDVYSVPVLDPSKAYVFHQTAVAMAQRAPLVPAGAPWGASASQSGLAIRTVRVFDPDNVEDRFVADAWIGANVVKDTGHWTAAVTSDGKFVPVTDPASPVTGDPDAWKNDTAQFVRAVKITCS